MNQAKLEPKNDVVSNAKNLTPIEQTKNNSRSKSKSNTKKIKIVSSHLHSQNKVHRQQSKSPVATYI